MATTVGNLRVNLTAYTKQFTTGMKGAGKSVLGFGGKVGGAVKSLFSLQGAMAGLGIAAMVAGLRRMSTELDKVTKSAHKLGMKVGELQKLQFAGELTGVSGQTMAMAMQRFTKRIGQATIGKGEAVPIFKELGLDPNVLALKGTYEALLDVAEAMKDVELATERTRIAFGLFDSEGVGLSETMAGGRKALEELTKKLRFVTTEVEAELNERVRDTLSIGWQNVKGFAFGATIGGTTAAYLNVRDLITGTDRAGDIAKEAYKTKLRIIEATKKQAKIEAAMTKYKAEQLKYEERMADIAERQATTKASFDVAMAGLASQIHRVLGTTPTASQRFMMQNQDPRFRPGSVSPFMGLGSNIKRNMYQQIVDEEERLARVLASKASKGIGGAPMGLSLGLGFAIKSTVDYMAKNLQEMDLLPVTGGGLMAALTRGSAGAYSAIVGAQDAPALREARKQTDLLRKIEQKVEPPQPVEL